MVMIMSFADKIGPVRPAWRGHCAGWMKALVMTSVTVVLGLGLTGCETVDPLKLEAQQKLEENRAAHASFRQQSGWKRQSYRNDELLAKAGNDNTRIEISLQEQRGLLIVNDLIAMDFPIASGKRSHPTPAGDYTVISKKRDHASNLYGRYVDGESGETLQRDVDVRRDPLPEGARFVGAPMPYWIRLTNTGIGLHVGDLPGYPASHGCVRLPRAVAPDIFNRVAVGTPVLVAPMAPLLETYAAMAGQDAEERET